jgi:Recombination endonuclease VII
VAKGKARTDAQKERAKDLRIQSKFAGFTLADRNNWIEAQSGKCAVCGGPLEPPVIDHHHFKVEATRYSPNDPLGFTGWQARAMDERGDVVCARSALTKVVAIQDVRKAYIQKSIRGIICIRCNYGLGILERFFNCARHPQILLDLYNYLGKRLGLTHID